MKTTPRSAAGSFAATWVNCTTIVRWRIRKPVGRKTASPWPRSSPKTYPDAAQAGKPTTIIIRPFLRFSSHKFVPSSTIHPVTLCLAGESKSQQRSGSLSTLICRPSRLLIKAAASWATASLTVRREFVTWRVWDPHKPNCWGSAGYAPTAASAVRSAHSSLAGRMPPPAWEAAQELPMRDASLVTHRNVS